MRAVLDWLIDSYPKYCSPTAFTVDEIIVLFIRTVFFRQYIPKTNSFIILVSYGSKFTQTVQTDIGEGPSTSGRKGALTSDCKKTAPSTSQLRHKAQQTLAYAV
jgi:hypothetical protein